ncbi:ras GTPase-activating-like protein IQGAP1 isoform X2 [Cloeon dipterum]|uniref:ras GTPase-activating-like protein IQGAP1 isoform X2 n=1 Tax=Cloeon dipterum TaxID=197152 RepID=UPI0032200B89
MPGIVEANVDDASSVVRPNIDKYESMDEVRLRDIAYQYLCHLEESKKWLESVLQISLPPSTELEENLRNGVVLAKLGHLIAPEVVSFNKIYDSDQSRYERFGLQFRHTDNINKWIASLTAVKLPKTFFPETTDVYDKKNMPRVIYCIHALSTHLFRLGKTPAMSDMYGKVVFTDDEINLMKQELIKVGVQMPLFQKIGGLLSNEIPVDKVALHAAIIAINEALDKECPEAVLTALKLPAARLNSIEDNNIIRYWHTMSSAKQAKIEAAHNKSLSDSYTADAYDELLTQAEIQGFINTQNVAVAWIAVMKAVEEKDEAALFAALRADPLSLKAVEENCVSSYMEELRQQVENNSIQELPPDVLRSRQVLQNVITAGNNIALQEAISLSGMWRINKALRVGSHADTLRELQNPELAMRNVLPEAACLYHEEMKNDRSDLNRDLTMKEIQGCVDLLSKIAQVTLAVDKNNTTEMWNALKDLGDIFSLDEYFIDEYWNKLYELRQKKLMERASCPILTFFDIDDCVNKVHQKIDMQNQLVAALQKLNRAVRKTNQHEVYGALKLLSSEIGIPAEEKNSRLYLRILQAASEEENRETSELWLSDASMAMKTAASESKEAEFACVSLIKIHLAMKERDEKGLISALQSAPFRQNLKIFAEYSKEYMTFFINCYKQKVAKKYTSPCVVYVTRKNHKAYINLTSNRFDWNPPESLENSPYLSPKEIGKLVEMLNNELSAPSDYESEKSISPDLFQAHLTKSIVQIQRWWRAVLGKRFLQQRIAAKRRKPVEPDLTFYKRHERKIVLIQSAWRGHQTRKMFLQLVHKPNPSLSIVRRFVSVLAPNDKEFHKENEIQLLKAKIAKAVRHNQTLSHQLEDMDVKIGLLVQNRISLHDVQAHHSQMNDLAGGPRATLSEQNSAGGSSNTLCGKGLKSLTKEGRHLLEGYQNLFYLLQTRPHYLSKLLFCLPHSKSMHFLQDVIFSLFNFGSSKRDEYLLLKLLKTALEEEIRCKFKEPIDILKVYPQVLKIAVNFSRQHSGQNALREILGCLVQRVVSDKNTIFETNPIEIYNNWINKMEMTTGTASEMPRNVTAAEALSHEEVRSRLQKGISCLQEMVGLFLERICSSREQLPYSLLHTARTLHNTLAERFPGFPEKDLLKVIGNVVYYHFINAAIVAPDAYDVVTLPADKTLTSDQRSNLASIAKILQYAASKKGFGDESSHLKVLNPFIIQCHEKFKRFLTLCCQVEDLEEHFGVHAYSEATMIVKPTILISLQELWDTHQLVLQYEDDIAPKHSDPLHTILEGLGPLTAVRKLLGGTSTDSLLPKGDINLTLSNSKLEILTDQFSMDKGDTNQSQLFIIAKELLVALLPFLSGANLSEALNAEELPGQNEQFLDQQKSSTSQQNSSNNSHLHLSKRRLQLWLGKLEQQGLVSSKNHFQDMLTAVAKDIVNRGQYCQARRKELSLLKTAIQSLEEKTLWYQKQVEFYNKYIETCLASMDSGKRRVHQLRLSGQHPGKAKTQKVLKYTAAQLHAKGVLQQMQGLTQSQFKSVQFEISATESVGVFHIKGCFMGIPMDSVEIDIQDLLQLQYEGRAIMDMFGKAKVNVNLLLYLLNKKFYGKY